MAPPTALDQREPLPLALVRVTRIIWAAQLLGQLVFAAVLPVLLQQTPGASTLPPTNLLLAIDAALLGLGIALALVVRWWLRRSPPQRLPRRYQPAVFLPMGPLEAAAFFGLIIVLLSRQWWPMIVIPAVAFALQLLLFPRAAVQVG